MALLADRIPRSMIHVLGMAFSVHCQKCLNRER